MNKIIEENNFDKEKFEKIISEYYETEKIALTDELLELLPEDKKPGILERESVGSKIKSYIFDFVEKFD